MSNADWNLVFRRYTTGELLKLEKKLKTSLTTLTSQSVGSKSFTRDLREVRDQLSSVAFVLTERGTPLSDDTRITITDFSGSGRGSPAGVIDPLS